MKRLLLLSIGVLVSAGLGLQLGQVTLAVSRSEDLLSDLFAESNVAETDTKDAKELNTLAQNDELPFENLYLFMFQNVTKGPSEAALEQLQDRLKEKKRRDFTVDELREIVVEGSLEPIISKWQDVAGEITGDPTYFDTEEERVAAQDAEYAEFQEANDFSASIGDFYEWYYQEYVRENPLEKTDTITSLPQEEILDEYTFLVGLYQNELDLQREFRKYAYQSIAEEMFFNNDLSDSANIDILNDLDQAHYVLFGSVIDYPDRSGSEPVLASEEEVDLQSLEDSVPSLALEDPALSPEEVDEMVVTLSSDVVSPYTCFEDEGLRDALAAYYESDIEEENGLDEEESTIVYPSLTSDPSSDTDDDEESSELPEEDSPEEAVDKALQDLDGFITELQGTQGDWTRSLPCSEVFCITVELISDTEDPVVENNYGATSNCVLCHLAYINKRMGETLDKSLVTSKPSQNWFEDATCKEAGSQVNLDLNVYTIAMPIDLDPGDDIDDAANERIEDLRNTLISLGQFSPNKTAFDKVMEDVACESILNLYDAANSNTLTLSSAQEACVDAAEEIQKNVDQAIQKLDFEAMVGDGNTLYEQSSAELFSMLLIFQNIQDGIKQTYITDDAPLNTLMKKKYCQ